MRLPASWDHAAAPHSMKAAVSVVTQHLQMFVVPHLVIFALCREARLKSVSVCIFKLNSQAYEKTMLFSISQ